MSISARYISTGYPAAVRGDIDFNGASGECLYLFQKTVVISAHAHYRRTPSPDSRVGRTDEKLQNANPGAVASAPGVIPRSA